MKEKEKIFYRIKQVIEEEESTFWSLLLKIFLSFLSYPVYFYIFFKNFLYDKKIFKPTRVSCKVISIGNVVAGGTGKTPFTIYLAQKLIKKRLKVAIVSRGYGVKRKKKEVFILGLEEGAYSDSTLMGDEPSLIFSRVPQVKIFVGSDKVLCAKKAAPLVDVILLDDGFQSRYLYRDLEIVLVDFLHPFANGRVLPRGLLRDLPKSLRRANLIVVTNAKEGSSPVFEKQIPTISSSSYLSGFKDLVKNKVTFSKGKIGAFCAIANPKKFYEMLRQEKFELVEELSFFDHSSFDIPLLINFSNRAKEKGAKALICTEKDMIKLPKNLNLSLPIYYAELEFKIIEDEKKLEEEILKTL
jgi:tetraacyldisaccharide 4'-kinase